MAELERFLVPEKSSSAAVAVAPLGLRQEAAVRKREGFTHAVCEVVNRRGERVYAGVYSRVCRARQYLVKAGVVRRGREFRVVRWERVESKADVEALRASVFAANKALWQKKVKKVPRDVWGEREKKKEGFTHAVYEVVKADGKRVYVGVAGQLATLRWRLAKAGILRSGMRMRVVRWESLDSKEAVAALRTALIAESEAAGHKMLNKMRIDGEESSKREGYTHVVCEVVDTQGERVFVTVATEVGHARTAAAKAGHLCNGSRFRVVRWERLESKEAAAAPTLAPTAPPTVAPKRPPTAEPTVPPTAPTVPPHDASSA